jgi:ribosomal protein L13E
MVVTCNVYRICGVDYVKREEAERLLTEADERRRLQMQEIIDRLEQRILEHAKL